MKFVLQLFGGRGAGSGRYRYYLPKNPKNSRKFRDITDPRKKERTRYRNYKDDETGLEVEFHPGKTGEKGWQGKDHYHEKIQILIIKIIIIWIKTAILALEAVIDLICLQENMKIC